MVFYIFLFIIFAYYIFYLVKSYKYKLKRCSNKECCKQCRYVKDLQKYEISNINAIVAT